MRDLKADLELCEKATWGKWRAVMNVLGLVSKVEFTHLHKGEKLCGSICFVEGGCNHENDAVFIAEAKQGWPHAIERALKAEENNKYLQVELDKAHGLLNELNIALLKKGEANAKRQF